MDSVPVQSMLSDYLAQFNKHLSFTTCGLIRISPMDYYTGFPAPVKQRPYKPRLRISCLSVLRTR